MHPSEMFTLCDHNYLAKILLKLKVKRPPCMSCNTGKLQRHVWHHTGENNKSIRKFDHSKPVKCTSIDQIISAQQGLVPRIPGRHTRERITSATFFLIILLILDTVFCVYHFHKKRYSNKRQHMTN